MLNSDGCFEFPMTEKRQKAFIYLETAHYGLIEKVDNYFNKILNDIEFLKTINRLKEFTTNRTHSRLTFYDSIYNRLSREYIQLIEHYKDKL